MKSGRVVAVALVLVAVVGLSGCDWTMLGFDGSRSGDNASESMMTPQSVATLSRRWQASRASWALGPVVAGDTVFVMDDRRDPHGGWLGGWGVRALVASSGAVRWSKVLATWGDPSQGGLAVSGSTLFVPSHGSLLALDVATGSLRWSAPVGSGVGADPLVVGSTVFIADAAFDVASGRLLWRASEPTATVQAVADGVAILSTPGPIPDWSHPGSPLCQGAGTVWGVDASSGALLWSWSWEATRHPVSATVVDHRVAVSILGCGPTDWPWISGTDVFDVKSGATAWSINSVWMRGAAEHQLLGQSAAGLQAYNPATGAPLWSTPAANCGMNLAGVPNPRAGRRRRARSPSWPTATACAP